MRRVIGPIVTTGVALVAAGAVVANPVIAPRSDVQIPAVALSAGSDPSGVGMLDQAFLDAIAPAPPESTNPFSVLRQLISSLAADATYMGKNALVNAFVAGVTAVSEPELTAASFPYVAPPAGLAGVSEFSDATALLPGFDSAAVPAVDIRAIPAGASAFINEALMPAVAHVVTSLAADAHYVTGELIAAVYAAGAVVASEPGLIADTLTALVRGDIPGALHNAVKVVTAPFGPTAMIIDAFHAVVVKHLAQLPTFTLVAPDPTPTSESGGIVLTATAQPEPAASVGRSTRQIRVPVTGPVGGPPAPVASLPRPAAAINSVTGRDVGGSDADSADAAAPVVTTRATLGVSRQSQASTGGGKAAAMRSRGGQAAGDAD